MGSAAHRRRDQQRGCWIIVKSSWRGGTAITPQMAQDAIEARIAPLPAESRPLELCIGRTLRQEVYAERDNPPFDRVCMDGVAINSAALDRGARRFTVEATQPAGAPARTLTSLDNAIEVMTGAVLPNGADCVIPMEEYELTGTLLSLNAGVSATPHRNVQRRGSDSEPGVAMLKPGTYLGPPELAVLASAGLARAEVSRQPRLAVVSTGDELVEPGQPIEAHQVRRSNAYAILAALRQRGFDEVGHDHIPDDEAKLRARLARHLQQSDAVILSGGVAKGKFDLVPKVLQSLGVEQVFHQIAQRPGMPMWFGIAPAGQAVFGLPGNPVATLICLLRYVVPALTVAMRATRKPSERVALATPVDFRRPVTYFLPVAIHYGDHGQATAVPRPPRGSGDFLALTRADGFVELPPQPAGFAPGFVASFYRW